MIPRLPRVHAAGHMHQSVYDAPLLRLLSGRGCTYTAIAAQSLPILTNLIYVRSSALGVFTATSSDGSWRIVGTPLDRMTYGEKRCIWWQPDPAPLRVGLLQ